MGKEGELTARTRKQRQFTFDGMRGGVPRRGGNGSDDDDVAINALAQTHQRSHHPTTAVDLLTIESKMSASMGNGSASLALCNVSIPMVGQGEEMK